jgi:peptide deformylase
MIKPLIQYPTPLSVEYGVDVRVFDEDLFALIEDLKDTMNENNLDGLAAFQIGSYYNVVVIKDDSGEILELINPRIIKQEGKITTLEHTAYYPGREAQIERFESLSVIYQDREGKSASLQARGEFAVTLQRKIDYTFGATFIQKMTPSQREQFESGGKSSLDIGYTDYCPTEFKRDKILHGIKFIYLALFLSIIIGLFLSDEQNATLWQYQLYISYVTVGFNIFYFFYAYFEGKKYTSCTSCQIGNIIGTTFISLVKLTVLMGIAYFTIAPN